MSSSSSSSSCSIDSRLFPNSDDDISSNASDEVLCRDEDQSNASVAVVVTLGISACVLPVFPFYGIISIGLAWFILVWVDLHSRTLARGPNSYVDMRSLLVRNAVVDSRQTMIEENQHGFLWSLFYHPGRRAHAARRDGVKWITMEQMELKLQQEHILRQQKMEQRRQLENSQYADIEKRRNSGEKMSAEAIRSPKELMK